MKFVNSTSCSSSSCSCTSNCCCCSSSCCCPVIISCKNILMHSCRTSCINMLDAPKEMPENYPAIMPDKSVELLLQLLLLLLRCCLCNLCKSTVQHEVPNVSTFVSHSRCRFVKLMQSQHGVCMLNAEQAVAASSGSRQWQHLHSLSLTLLEENVLRQQRKPQLQQAKSLFCGSWSCLGMLHTL